MSRPPMHTLCTRCHQWRTRSQMVGSHCKDCVCIATGCRRPIDYRQVRLCDKHYRYQRRTGRTIYAPRNRDRCAGPDCDRLARVRGLCDTHYRQDLRGGPLKPIRPIAGPAMHVDELVVEVGLLAGTDTPERVAARLGLKLRSIERQLDRAGRRDLWHRLTGKAAA